MAAGDLGTLRVKIEADGRALSRGLKTSTSQVKAFGSVMQKEIKNNAAGWQTLGMAVTGFGVALAAVAAISVSTFASFEQTMRNVQSVAGATDDQFVEMTEHARELGETTVFTARQAGDAMYLLASAGFSAEQQMASTAAILDLAAATQADLSQATALTVTTLKAFGLEAKDAGRATNVFAATIASSMANMERLSTAMPVVSSTFNLLGYSVETASAALGILFDRGLQASTAGTRLRIMLNKLLDVTPKAAAAIGDLGIKIEDVNPAANSLVDIVRQFETHGLDAASAAKIFGVRAEGMTLLVSAGADALEAYTEKITGTDRAAEMAAIQLDTLTGDIKLLKSAVEGAAIALGEGLAPVIRSTTRLLTELIGKFNALPQSMKTAVAAIGAGAAGLALFVGAGALLLSQLPNMILGFAALTSGIETMRIAFMLAGTSMATVLGVGGLIAVGTGLIYAGFRGIKAHNRETRNWIETQIELGVTMTEINGKMVDLRRELDNTGNSIIAITERYGAVNTALMTFGRGNDAVVDKSGATTESIDETTKKLNEEKRALANLTNVTYDNIEAILHAAMATDSWAVDIDKMTAAIANLKITEANYKKVKTKDIEDLEEAYDTFFDNTEKFYETSSLNDLQYWRGVREQGRLTADAMRFINRRIQIASEETYDVQKLGFATVITKEREGFEERVLLDTEFFGKVKRSGQRRFDADKEAAENRLKTEVNINARLGNIQGEFDAEAISEQVLNLGLIQANTRAFQYETEAELDEHNKEILASTAEKNAGLIVQNADTYDELQLGILKFHAFELDQQDAKVALLLREYKEIEALFAKHGGDMIALEKWKNEQIRDIQIEHQGTFRNIVTDGVSDLANELRPAVENLFETLFSPDIDFDQFLKSLGKTAIRELSQVATSALFGLAKEGIGLVGREPEETKAVVPDIGIEGLPANLEQSEVATQSLSSGMGALSISAEGLATSIQSATLAIQEYTAAAAEAGLLEALAEIITLDPGKEYEITSRAQGGIVTKPEIAIIGDNPGGRGEAVIPIPSGGKIPVELTGGDSRGDTLALRDFITAAVDTGTITALLAAADEEALPPPSFARGGIARRPMIARVGDGGVQEAIIPMPSGNVPVQLTGGGSRGDVYIEHISLEMPNSRLETVTREEARYFMREKLAGVIMEELVSGRLP